MDLTPQNLKAPVSYRSVLIVLIVSVVVLALAAYMYILSIRSDFALDFTNSKAAVGDVVMTLKAAPASVVVGQTFVINVDLDTGNKTATAAEVHLTFPAGLQLTASASGPLMPNILQSFPKTANKADITVAAQIQAVPTPPATPPPQGIKCVPPATGCAVATFTFKALQAGSFPIQIDVTTKVATLEDLNNSALATRVPVTVTATNPTPTPTPVVVSFTAVPPGVKTGTGAPASLTSSTLSWTVQNSTAVTLDGVAVAAAGTKVVSPTAATTYTLSAVNGTSAANSSTVTVAAKNISDFVAPAGVDIFDYNQFVNAFAQAGSPGWIQEDMNLDGTVNIFDFTLLVANFGR